MDYILDKTDQNSEYFLNLYALNQSTNNLLPFGHVIASEQLHVSGEMYEYTHTPGYQSLKTINNATMLKVMGNDFSVTFNKETGALSSYVLNNTELISEPLIPDFWRAPTDNDYGNNMPVRCKVWKDVMQNASLDAFTFNSQNEKVSIEVKLGLNSVKGTIMLAYAVNNNGVVDVNYTFEAQQQDLPEIPRIGMKMKMPKTFNNLAYYGRGPLENYCDRKYSQFIGQYTSKVADQFFAYTRPQENGYKTDVRHLSLSNQTGMGLKVIAKNEPIGFSALHYSTATLDEGEQKTLRRTIDISEGDYVELHIDHKMMGLGGDNSWGAKPHWPYMLYANKTYTYGFSLQPLHYIILTNIPLKSSCLLY